jgi:hypothetical protein
MFGQPCIVINTASSIFWINIQKEQTAVTKNTQQHLYERIVKELRRPSEISRFRSDAAGLDKVDTRDNTWRTNLNSYMNNHGFQMLGSGKYASVYGNESYPYVIKVFQRDSAYFRWLKFALNNRNNPYVPRIRGKVVKITPMVYAIRLEKLRPGYIDSEFQQHFDQWQRDPNYRADDPDLQQVFDFFHSNRKLLDLHNENVMRRGDQLVIIDPFYNWFGREAPGKYTIDPDEVDPDLF